MEISRINHVGLTVSDMARAIAFFQEAFDATLLIEFDLPAERVRAMLGVDDRAATGRVAWVRFAGGAIELFAFEPKQPAERLAWNRPGCTHFALQVTDVAAWHARLTAKGVRCLSAPQISHGKAHYFYAADPDGNLIELIELVG